MSLQETKSNIKLILVDTNKDVITAWQTAFSSCSRQVDIVEGDFRKLDQYDCLVSPANSFGIMDGGIDLVICHHFGWDLMARVQQEILREWCGQQPVGSCLLVPTGNVEHPWLAHSPTMRTPQTIAGTENIYYALWATLVAVQRHNFVQDGTRIIRTIACPGLGTGVGQVAPEECARQMLLAWTHFHQKRQLPPPPSALSTGIRLFDSENSSWSIKPVSWQYLIGWEEAYAITNEIASCAAGK